MKFFGRLPVKIEKGPPDRLFEARAEVVTAAWVRQGCNMRPNSLVQSTRADAIIRAVPVGAWRSPVSALVWGTRGRGFKSRRPDQKLQKSQKITKEGWSGLLPVLGAGAHRGHKIAKA